MLFPNLIVFGYPSIEFELTGPTVSKPSNPIPVLQFWFRNLAQAGLLTQAKKNNGRHRVGQPSGLSLEFLHFSRRSRRHIVAHSVSCGYDELEGKPANAGDISTLLRLDAEWSVWDGTATIGLYVARFAGLRGLVC
jgi:hypothetical protein